MLQIYAYGTLSVSSVSVPRVDNVAVHKQVDAVYPDVHFRDGEIVSMGKVVAPW